jgi:hypothetical protein
VNYAQYGILTFVVFLCLIVAKQIPGIGVQHAGMTAQFHRNTQLVRRSLETGN